MKKLLHRILIFSTPFIFILFAYITIDPYQIIWHYENHYNTNKKIKYKLNRDFVTVDNFEKHYPKGQYNSFIFGNSTSMRYESTEWKKYLDTGSKVYHFNAYGQTLFEIYHKIKYLDDRNVSLKNTLIVIDNMVLNGVKPRNGSYNYTIPQILKNKNLLKFHINSFHAFLNIELWYAIIDFKLTKKYKMYMNKRQLIQYPMRSKSQRPYNFTTNENYEWIDNENKIKKGNFYTKQKLSEFSKRTCKQKHYWSLIHKEQKEMLNEMKNILDKHKTNYKIIISPMSNQKKLNRKDINFLNKTFGKENIFNFSGINKFTENVFNYTDKLHYRPHVATEILEIIYPPQ